jgi:hypothetical protein
MRGRGTDRLVVAVMPGNAGGAKGAGCPGSFGGQPGCWEEPGERIKVTGETVRDFQAHGVGGVSEGQGQ